MLYLYTKEFEICQFQKHNEIRTLAIDFLQNGKTRSKDFKTQLHLKHAIYQ